MQLPFSCTIFHTCQIRVFEYLLETNSSFDEEEDFSMAVSQYFFPNVICAFVDAYKTKFYLVKLF